MSEKLREEMEEIRSTVQAFRELLNSRAWALLLDIAKVQIETRKNLLTQRAKGMEGVLELEYAKGEIAGIEIFTRIPSTALEDLEEQLSDIKEQLKEEEMNHDIEN